jgi:hypothetical protein
LFAERQEAAGVKNLETVFTVPKAGKDELERMQRRNVDRKSMCV